MIMVADLPLKIFKSPPPVKNLFFFLQLDVSASLKSRFFSGVCVCAGFVTSQRVWSMMWKFEASSAQTPRIDFTEK